EEVQMSEYEQLPVTPPYQGARKYGKTSFELGHEKGLEEGLEKGLKKGLEKGQLDLLMEQLADRFGPLSADVKQRLEALPPAKIRELAKPFYKVVSLGDLGLDP